MKNLLLTNVNFHVDFLHETNDIQKNKRTLAGQLTLNTNLGLTSGVMFNPERISNIWEQ